MVTAAANSSCWYLTRPRLSTSPATIQYPPRLLTPFLHPSFPKLLCMRLSDQTVRLGCGKVASPPPANLIPPRWDMRPPFRMIWTTMMLTPQLVMLAIMAAALFTRVHCLCPSIARPLLLGMVAGLARRPTCYLRSAPSCRVPSPVPTALTRIISAHHLFQERLPRHHGLRRRTPCHRYLLQIHALLPPPRFLSANDRTPMMVRLQATTIIGNENAKRRSEDDVNCGRIMRGSVTKTRRAGHGPSFPATFLRVDTGGIVRQHHKKLARVVVSR